MKRVIILIISLLLLAVLTGCLTTAPVNNSIPVSIEDVSGEGFILDDKVIYEYNSDGLRIKKYEYNKKNQIKETVDYIYENNILTGKKYYDEFNNYDSFENYQYDNEGRILKETEYKADGSVKNYKVYKYTDNNSYIKKYFKADGVLYRILEKKYDSSNNLIEEINMEADFYYNKK